VTQFIEFTIALSAFLVGSILLWTVRNAAWWHEWHGERNKVLRLMYDKNLILCEMNPRFIDNINSLGDRLIARGLADSISQEISHQPPLPIEGARNYKKRSSIWLNEQGRDWYEKKFGTP
jgi:hypothetical protein